LFLTPAAGETEGLAAALAGLGWRRLGRQVALGCDLPQPELGLPPGVAVEEIGPRQLNLWGSTLVRAYEVSPATGREIRAGWTSLLRTPGEGARARFYLAWLSGRPVGTGLYWGQGDVAGFYCGAVLPEHRRQGVERATMLRRMADAARDGRRAGMLQTEPGSPVEHLCLEHLGFRREYTRDLWVPPAQSGRDCE
jgi:GNAT superfamily N-acetyltransferase